MSARMYRRLVDNSRTSFRRMRRTLTTPSRWPKAKLAAISVAAVATTSTVLYYNQQCALKRTEQRVFTPGSPLHNITGSMRTGDILLFNRSILAPGASSISPLRVAIVMMQKLHGKSEYDHVGVIVVRNDYPYLLERGPSGICTLRPIDARLLHSSAKEIVLRRLNAPPMTEQDEARMERWIDQVIGSSQIAAPTSTPTSLTSSPRSSAASSSHPSINSSSSSPPSHISPSRLLAHLVLSYFLPRYGTTSSQTSSSITTLGNIIEIASQIRVTEDRMAEIKRKAQLNPSSSAAAAPSSISRKTGSVTPFQRLQVRRDELEARFDAAVKQFQAETTEASSTAATESEDLNRITDFPSATLVVRTLQMIGVLPSSSRSLQLTSDVIIPSSRLPSSAAYPTRQFLSSSSLPMIYQPQSSSSAPNNEPIDCFLDREMFIKSKNKALSYAIEE